MTTLSIRSLCASLCIAVLALVPFTRSSHAQTHGQLAEINVPFDFDYGPQHFPAGRYTLSAIHANSTLLWGAKIGLSMSRPEEGQHRSASSKIVFHKYGDHYFLREIWAGQNSYSFVECIESKAEKLARQQETTTALARNQGGVVGEEVALIVQ